MNPKYVTDLEHSRKLVEAGWKKKTEFIWLLVRGQWSLLPFETGDSRETFPAPLTDELLEELPFNGITINKDGVEINRGNTEVKSSSPNALVDLWCWWKGEQK